MPSNCAVAVFAPVNSNFKLDRVPASIAVGSCPINLYVPRRACLELLGHAGSKTTQVRIPMTLAISMEQENTSKHFQNACVGESCWLKFH